MDCFLQFRHLKPFAVCRNFWTASFLLNSRSACDNVDGPLLLVYTAEAVSPSPCDGIPGPLICFNKSSIACDGFCGPLLSYEGAGPLAKMFVHFFFQMTKLQQLALRLAIAFLGRSFCIKKQLGLPTCFWTASCRADC